MTGAPPSPDGGRIVTFYSYKGGTGRTMALANTAWITASQGRRVLVVDWDLEAPGLDRFLSPFLEPNALRDRPGVLDLINDYMLKVESLHPAPADEAWITEQADIGKAVSPLRWNFSGGGRLDYVSAGRQDRNYSSIFSQFNWNRFYEEQYGGQFLDALCAQFRRGYDYVLVDSRTGLSDISDICTIHFPDVLVNCFTHNDQSIEGAAAVARRVEDTYRDRRIRILPVPMRVEDSEADRLEAARAKVRRTFDQLLVRTPHVDPRRYWGQVEVPYKPTYAYEEILATFRDEPETPASLLAACERLTSVITEGEVSRLAPMTDEERQSYLKAVVRRRPPDPTHVFLSHVPEDRMWADWIGRVLTLSLIHRDRCPAARRHRQQCARGLPHGGRAVRRLPEIPPGQGGLGGRGRGRSDGIAAHPGADPGQRRAAGAPVLGPQADPSGQHDRGAGPQRPAAGPGRAGRPGRPSRGRLRQRPPLPRCGAARVVGSGAQRGLHRTRRGAGGPAAAARGLRHRHPPARYGRSRQDPAGDRVRAPLPR
nr:hypothetical protein [Streptomyces resistomycificus]